MGSTYLLSGSNLYRHAFPQNDAFRRAVWPIVLVGTAFTFKISMAGEAGERLPFWLQHIPHSWPWVTLITKARISLIVNIVGLTWFTVQWSKRRDTPWFVGAFGFINLFLLGQSRYVNIPLFLLFEAQRLLLEMSLANNGWVAMSCLWMQHVSFFALGNSNSLSSIDLSNAYNGISSYSIPLVGTLTFISNWAGPIWWSLAALQFLLMRHEETKFGGTNGYVEWMWWCSLFHGIVMCFLVTACIILRTHLFIWTVFSPKFLFQAAWIVLAHIFVQGVVGGLVWQIG